MKKGIFKKEDIPYIISFIVIVIVLIFAFIFQKPAECPECPECICQKCPDCVMDCSLCPEKTKTETETITVTKYVCPDERIVDNADDCESEPKPVLDTGFDPILTNEEGTSIVNVTLKPACIKGKNGGGIYFKTDFTSRDITFEVKEDVNQEYREIFKISNLIERYTQFEICDECTGGADFNLEKNRIYLFRLRFNMTVLNKVYYSNEHIINTNPESSYMTKKCS
ncbi:MAG: hypothetical protein KKE93_03750 [Nanoarchaeota archaeon]|nr:hypothetical protein [Nanoarchaeota archaeon]